MKTRSGDDIAKRLPTYVFDPEKILPALSKKEKVSKQDYVSKSSDTANGYLFLKKHFQTELKIPNHVLEFDDENHRILCYATLDYIAYSACLIELFEIFGYSGYQILRYSPDTGDSTDFWLSRVLRPDITDSRGNKLVYANDEFGSDFKKDAESFFAAAKSIPAPKTPDFNALLKGSFCVGENHSDASPKRFLIENMATLKSQGYQTLFMEHLLYDSVMQDSLNMYFAAPKGSDMPTDLKDYLLTQNSGHRVTDQKYNFYTLVQAAKENGIRVVGIDTTESRKMGFGIYGAGGPARLMGMNFAAQQIIQKETKGKEKWFSLMGNAHIETHEGVLGVAQILGVPSVEVFTTNEISNSQCDFSRGARKIGGHDISSDIRISCVAGQSLAMPSLSVPAQTPPLMEQKFRQLFDMVEAEKVRASEARAVSVTPAIYSAADPIKITIGDKTITYKLGAGCIDKLEVEAINLNSIGMAKGEEIRFNRAVEAGSRFASVSEFDIELEDLKERLAPENVGQSAVAVPKEKWVKKTKKKKPSLSPIEKKFRDIFYVTEAEMKARHFEYLPSDEDDPFDAWAFDSSRSILVCNSSKFMYTLKDDQIEKKWFTSEGNSTKQNTKMFALGEELDQEITALKISCALRLKNPMQHAINQTYGEDIKRMLKLIDVATGDQYDAQHFAVASEDLDLIGCMTPLPRDVLKYAKLQNALVPSQRSRNIVELLQRVDVNGGNRDNVVEQINALIPLGINYDFVVEGDITLTAFAQQKGLQLDSATKKISERKTSTAIPDAVLDAIGEDPAIVPSASVHHPIATQFQVYASVQKNSSTIFFQNGDQGRGNKLRVGNHYCPIIPLRTVRVGDLHPCNFGNQTL